MGRKPWVYIAELRRVVDGDTVDFNIDLGFGVWRRIRVRLKDVDTPELNSADLLERNKAHAARVFVEVMLTQADEIRIETFKDKQGKYGRWLADIYADEQHVNEILRGKGHV